MYSKTCHEENTIMQSKKFSSRQDSLRQRIWILVCCQRYQAKLLPQAYNTSEACWATSSTRLHLKGKRLLTPLRHVRQQALLVCTQTLSTCRKPISFWYWPLVCRSHTWLHPESFSWSEVGWSFCSQNGFSCPHLTGSTGGRWIKHDLEKN